MRKTVCFLGILMLSIGLLWAKDFWKEKPSTEWTQEEARKMVSESPWARLVRITSPAAADLSAPTPSETGGAMATTSGGGYSSVAGGQPATPSGTPGEGSAPVPETLYNVWWYSARTWRQGMARFQQLRGSLSADQAKSFVETRPSEYVIAVRGDDMRAFQGVSDDVLRGGTYLRARRTKHKLAPSRIELQRSPDGQRISMILFYFPRTVEGEPFVAPDEKGVDFVCEIKGLSLSTTFDVRNMKAWNELDL